MQGGKEGTFDQEREDSWSDGTFVMVREHTGKKIQ